VASLHTFAIASDGPFPGHGELSAE
jgi:hypothetical protein